MILILFLSLSLAEVTLEGFTANIDIYDSEKMGNGKNFAFMYYERQLVGRTDYYPRMLIHYEAMQPWRQFEYTFYNTTIDSAYSTQPRWMTLVFNQDYTKDDVDVDDSEPIGDKNDICYYKTVRPLEELKVSVSQYKQKDSKSDSINGEQCWSYPGYGIVENFWFTESIATVTDPYMAGYTLCRIDYRNGKQIFIKDYKEIAKNDEIDEVVNKYFAPTTKYKFTSYCKRIFADTQYVRKSAVLFVFHGIPVSVMQLFGSNIAVTLKNKFPPESRFLIVTGVNDGDTVPNITTGAKEDGEPVEYDAFIAAMPKDWSGHTKYTGLATYLFSKAMDIVDKANLSDFDVNIVYLGQTPPLSFNSLQDRLAKTKGKYKDIYVGYGGTDPTVRNRFNEFTTNALKVLQVDFNEGSGGDQVRRTQIDVIDMMLDRLTYVVMSREKPCKGFVDGALRCNCPMCCEDTCFYSFCDASVGNGECTPWPADEHFKKINCDSDCSFTYVCKDRVGCTIASGEDPKCEKLADCKVSTCTETPMIGTEPADMTVAECNAEPACTVHFVCTYIDKCGADVVPVQLEGDTVKSCHRYECNDDLSLPMEKRLCVPMADPEPCVVDETNKCMNLSCDDGKCVKTPKTCTRRPYPYTDNECYTAECDPATGACVAKPKCTEELALCTTSGSADGCRCSNLTNYECVCDHENGCAETSDLPPPTSEEKWVCDLRGLDGKPMSCAVASKECELNVYTWDSTLCHHNSCEDDGITTVTKALDCSQDEAVLKRVTQCEEKPHLYEIYCQLGNCEWKGTGVDDKCYYCQKDTEGFGVLKNTCPAGKISPNGLDMKCVKGQCVEDRDVKCKNINCFKYKQNPASTGPPCVRDEDYPDTLCPELEGNEDELCYANVCKIYFYADPEGNRTYDYQCVKERNDNPCIINPNGCRKPDGTCNPNTNICEYAPLTVEEDYKGYNLCQTVECAVNTSTNTPRWEVVYDVVESAKSLMTDKCQYASCDPYVGELEIMPISCDIATDFPTIPENMRICYDCNCETSDGQAVKSISLKVSTTDTKYSIDECGYCSINGKTLSDVPCTYYEAIDTTAPTVVGTVIAVVILVVVVALIIILIGTKKTYDLIMQAKAQKIDAVTDNEVFQQPENVGSNPTFNEGGAN